MKLTIYGFPTKFELSHPGLEQAIRDVGAALVESQLRLALAESQTAVQIARIAEALEQIAEHLVRPDPVQNFTCNFTSQREDTAMATIFMVGALSWSPVTDPDCDHLELTVTRDGTATTDNHTPDSAGVTPFEAPVGQVLGLSIVSVDAAGNKAAPTVIPDFTVSDTVPPPAVEGFGVQFTSQRSQA